MEEKRDLLDWLAQVCGGANLSDLRYTQAWKTALESVAPEDFSLRDWNEAVYYLYRRPLKFDDAASAKACLLHYKRPIE